MKKIRVAERRKAQRLNIAVPMRYRLYLKKRALSQPILTDNISGTGLGLTLTEPLKKNAKLDVHIYFHDDPKPVVSTSRVAWCKKETKKGLRRFKAGIRHVEIAPTDRERFVFLFCETMLNYLLGLSGVSKHR